MFYLVGHWIVNDIFQSLLLPFLRNPFRERLLWRQKSLLMSFVKSTISNFSFSSVGYSHVTVLLSSYAIKVK